jgi:uncharacterized membrane protein
LSAGDIVDPIAVAMIATQYIGMFLIAGVVLLASLLLPFNVFRRGRMLLGVLCLLAAAGIFLWTMYVYPS